MIRAVLFDKDGTLLDFACAWHRIFTIVFRLFQAELGITESAGAHLQRLIGYLDRGFEAESVAQHMSSSEIIERWTAYLGRPDLRGPMWSTVQQVATGPTMTIDLLPGVASTLRELSAKGYQMGVATADSLESTRTGLARAGILHYFSFLGCDDGVYPPKPDPSMAHEFRRVHGLAAHELLVVGDSLTDRAFAANAGARFVGIATEYNRFGRATPEEPGFGTVIRSMDELIGLCELWAASGERMRLSQIVRRASGASRRSVAGTERVPRAERRSVSVRNPTGARRDRSPGTVCPGRTDGFTGTDAPGSRSQN